MILEYQKFFENKDSEFGKRIKDLNIIKDIFTDLEDAFGITILYRYFQFDQRTGFDPLSNYKIYDEKGRRIGEFATKYHAPNGYYPLSIHDPNYQGLDKTEKKYGPKFTNLVDKCINRAKIMVDTELEVGTRNLICLEIK